jgi:hypothetical protein
MSDEVDGGDDEQLLKAFREKQERKRLKKLALEQSLHEKRDKLVHELWFTSACSAIVVMQTALLLQQ